MIKDILDSLEEYINEFIITSTDENEYHRTLATKAIALTIARNLTNDELKKLGDTLLETKDILSKLKTTAENIRALCEKAYEEAEKSEEFETVSPEILSEFFQRNMPSC